MSELVQYVLMETCYVGGSYPEAGSTSSNLLLLPLTTVIVLKVPVTAHANPIKRTIRGGGRAAGD